MRSRLIFVYQNLFSLDIKDGKLFRGVLLDKSINFSLKNAILLVYVSADNFCSVQMDCTYCKLCGSEEVLVMVGDWGRFYRASAKPECILGIGGNIDRLWLRSKPLQFLTNGVVPSKLSQEMFPAITSLLNKGPQQRDLDLIHFFVRVAQVLRAQKFQVLNRNRQVCSCKFALLNGKINYGLTQNILLLLLSVLYILSSLRLI